VVSADDEGGLGLTSLFARMRSGAKLSTYDSFQAPVFAYMKASVLLRVARVFA
jgi:hypothetical protein